MFQQPVEVRFGGVRGSASTEPPSATAALPPHLPSELLVQFSTSANAQMRAAALSHLGGTVAEAVRGNLPGQAGEGLLVRVTIGNGLSVEQAIELISRQPGVRFAEPNYLHTASVTSDDPSYTDGTLWGMYGDGTSPTNQYGSQAGEAWAAGQTGSSKVVIGVIDSGVDYTHPDLYLNIWLNQNEIPQELRSVLKDVNGHGLIGFRDLNSIENASYVSDINKNGRIDAGDLLNDSRWENGLDDDANGYVDDFIGWDFVGNDNDPYDDNNHGTHVSGTIAGLGGNGQGVAGVTWSTQIVALKFLSGSGSGSTANAIKAVDYFTAASKAAIAQDFAATNNSWGGGGYSQALLDSIVRGAKADILFVAAAGNGGSDGRGDDNDSTANYPSNYDTTAGAGYDAVISVASITKTGSLSSFSNYGQKTVDLGAPGSSIYSTVAGGGYATYSGTSMATPHVAGAIALYSALSGESAATIKGNLLTSSVATSSLVGKTVTGGRLDAAGMAKLAPLSAPTQPIVPDVSIKAAKDDYGRTTVDVQNGGTTDDHTPVLTGTVSAALGAGEVVAIYRDGVKIGEANVAADLTWQFAEPGVAAATHGSAPSYSYSAKIIASDGSQKAASVNFTMTVAPDAIFGSTSSETIAGSAAPEKLYGLPSSGTHLGKGTIDTLIGGGGSDMFVLGDGRGRFYDDANSKNAGKSDFAHIKGFDSDDLIQLFGSQNSYFQQSTTLSDGTRGIGIYHDSNGNGRFDSRDELIGFIEGVQSQIPWEHFVFV